LEKDTELLAILYKRNLK